MEAFSQYLMEKHTADNPNYCQDLVRKERRDEVKPGASEEEIYYQATSGEYIRLYYIFKKSDIG